MCTARGSISVKRCLGEFQPYFRFFLFLFFCLGVIYGEFSFAIYFVVNYTFLARLIHAFNFQKDERIFRKMVVKKKKETKKEKNLALKITKKRSII